MSKSQSVREFSRRGQKWQIPRTFYRVCIKLIVIDTEGRLLVLSDTHTGKWEIPGGGVRHGESFISVAFRETQEELAVELATMDEQPLFVCIGEHPDGYPTVKVYHRATLQAGKMSHEDHFISRWVTKEEFAALDMPGDESPAQEYAHLIWGDN